MNESDSDNVRSPCGHGAILTQPVVGCLVCRIENLEVELEKLKRCPFHGRADASVISPCCLNAVARNVVEIK